VPRRRHQHEDGLPRLDERDRTVLQLAGGEALGVDVRDLLELERTLESDRVADVATEEQHRAGVGHPARELGDVLVLVRQHPGDLLREGAQLVDVGGGIRDRAADSAHVQAQQQQGGDLRRERLGRGDRDLGTGMGVDHGIRLARNGGALGVAHGERACAALACVLHGHERVHGLARLADRDDERVGADHRVAVAELVRELDVDSDARPLLDRVLADERGVRRGAAGRDDHAVDADEEVVESVELGDDDLPVLDASADRVRHGLGLLGDLLGHEARPSALLGGCGIP
jgi:hypothetical protein